MPQLLSCRESHAYDRSDHTFTETLNGLYYLNRLDVSWIVDGLILKHLWWSHTSSEFWHLGVCKVVPSQCNFSQIQIKNEMRQYNSEKGSCQSDTGTSHLCKSIGWCCDQSPGMRLICHNHSAVFTDPQIQPLIGRYLVSSI